LVDASSGLCAAMAALPDLPASHRAFTNLAHAQLHVLASDPRLDRSSAAAVLEAMLRVEDDFANGRAIDARADLPRLKSAADTALGALDVEVPPCER
jgi:hypothetical protein